MRAQIQIFTVLVLLILAICPLARANADCDFRYSNYARAVQLHDMGDYDAALRHYDCALAEDPDDAVIPLLIANVHEDIANAGSAWSRAASPTTAEILGLPPVSTWGERRPPSRRQDFQDLLVPEPASSERLRGRAGLPDTGRLIAVARRGDSLWFFNASGIVRIRLVAQGARAPSDTDPVERAGDFRIADDFIEGARIFVRNLDWTRARIRFEQALGLDPDRIDIRCELGMVYLELGEARAALRQFDMVLLQDPIDACARPNREALLRRLRDG